MAVLIPSSFNFSNLDQMLLSAGAAERLLVACLLGGAVGLERELRHKASGIRTNMLMCMACASFTFLSAALAGDGNPKGQVAANIVQGVGFLGAGLILHTRSQVLGLTSAASIFVVASIGMACGAGLYLEALIATFIVLVALQAIGLMEAHLPIKQYPLLYEIRSHNATDMFAAILDVLDASKIRMNVVDRDTLGSMERVTFMVNCNRRKHQALEAALKQSITADQVNVYPDADPT